ncbi:MAG TPA: adenylosuccinate lyase [Candidatus Brocadiia bacterium]|nr:adenylosuccinate lyase [Candidatus Brocadiia bacterium]
MVTSSDIHDEFVSPFALRWAGREMLENWSEQKKWSTARRLWVALAQAERELGLAISQAQIDEMRAKVDDIDFERAAELEKELRHDVMAHIRTFGEQCPKAAPVIHLGATSCYVGDNAEMIQMRDGLALVRKGLVNALARMAAFARKWRDLPTLAYTHFQPAQLTTVGKRACLWAQDLCMDIEEVDRQMVSLPFRGVKGTTGTQASFLELFKGDHEKVKQLNAKVAAAMGFERVAAVTGQTYPRKVDWQVLSALCGVAQSAGKFASDMRLMQSLKEMEEPFGAKQVGSSAMAYKRNPMRCERICGLARFVINMSLNPAHTAATQWFERTLDDSSNRRLCLAESFLAVDSILSLVVNVAEGMVVHEPVIRQRVARELPFMATEPILMAAVAAGGDRQELHERIRVHSMAVSQALYEGGGVNDLLDRIAADPGFAAVKSKMGELSDPRRFVGRAPEQVDEFLAEVVGPLLEQYAADLGAGADLRV